MSFSSINIQGNIVSSEILDKIRSEEKFKHQTPEAFGLSRSASLRDEIGMAWSIMRTHWQAYKRRLENLPQGDTGTSLTREKLIVPLLTELGYVMGLQRAQLINGKSYNISHGATNIDNYPIHIMGYNDNLDKRRDTGGQKVSPHALVQEYLNNTEHLYALVTNGRHLRLLRDATRLVRMSYLEFDLERMFEEELYADFSLLFRVLHATRMPQKMEAGAEAVIEYYHQESMASGTRIRTKLSEAVEISIKTLANGFLEHPKNTDLVALLDNNQLNASNYYTHQLRLIYRILFLIVLEERKLIFPEELTADQQRFREIYFKYYSIERLRKLTENKVYIDADKYDLWESLKTTFLLFENQEYGNKIGIKPLGSGLFASNALGTLKEQFLSNGNLIEVLKRLTTFVNEQNQLVRVNYSDLDVEEFGSVYEGLLEYDPVLTKIEHQYHFSFVTGDGRSSSGSHYTPEELVKPLIKHSLEYIIADKLKETNPEEALLSITVCDVACGSGHILLSAARKIAAELASIREGAEQPSPAFYRAAIRDVIKNCIYGVDLNPLAVELCKVALWLEAHEPGQPMNFLDHHIKCGNAIVGLAHFEELEKGIASEAFKTLPGDEKEIATAFRNRNNLEIKTTGQLTTYNVEQADESLRGLQKDFQDFVRLPEDTPAQIAKKEAAYHTLTTGKKWFRLKQIADLQVAQFFIPKTDLNKDKLTTQSQYMNYLKSGAQILDRGAAMAVSIDKRFFHWFLEFPQVFQNGGFDCILGNPPYLGDKKLKKAYGDQFIEFVKQRFTDVGANDLVVYFFNRIFNLINSKNSFMALLSTDSISEGDLRIGALSKLITDNSKINFAVKSTPWPQVKQILIFL
ncbi:Eco57I restriction-modification methylase domain-containing protein [Flavobacterium frigoris]|uniref:site-specific DNA-methyltransferase (adenine-specific) n=1 Tax=Flavobacterium frigoris TaxID=229204 RepID=A0A1H9HZX3_FLAFI|nr:DNA methyltransferase [Flavobacterium frigoris]SEQ67959.1 N-6 DNA Methylase [Flavobacterium frigoris]